MNPFNLRRIQLLLLLLAALCTLSATTPAYATGSRDILWSILNTCLDPTVPNYCSSCRSPVLDSPCAQGKKCKETTEVWVLTPEYVALRDRKMCDCPEEFVHGLVMPLNKVTGVEDPRRPDGIWNFAWAIACSRIEDDMERALAVNPPGNRDQDQLHVHVVRLQKDARKRFDAERVWRIADLDQVWRTAGNLAKANGLADYGVLVAAHPEGGYLVLVDQASTEKTYTVPRCN